MNGKRVRWSTVTVYEFGVALGGSAVPKRGGPSIGLAREPLQVWSAPLDELAARDEHARRTKRKRERTASERTASERRPEPKAKRVRWLKPTERVAMLERAGCSAQQICAMMAESSDIAMSRRLCVSLQRRAVAV